MTIQQGTRLGRYEIKSLLGAGGMGEVYLARDIQLDRPVALKLLPSEYTRDENRLHRFVREAKAASALNHPNIVTIYEIGESEAGRFIAMELIEGRTLRTPTNARPSLESLLQFTSQVAKALQVAHAAGIVHRDIKPENIMVRDDGYIKVLDFGLARLVPGGTSQPQADTIIMGSDDMAPTAAGVIMGTVRYMSPEQARGERVAGATDIFSLGILLYELATGRHPFEADSQIGVLNAILTQSVIPPRRVNPEIPLVLEALILQMLEKDSRLRPGAAEIDLALIESANRGTDAETGLTVIPVERHTVGHETERAELRRGFEEAATGRGLMLCVAGEPGIGKTTLIEDFLTELTLSDANSLIARGRCSERLAGAEAYLPFLEALESLLHVEACESVARLMKLMAPTWYVQIIPFANEGSAERLQADAKAASQEWMKRELGSFLEAVSQTRPLVLFLDDLHWSDVSTVELLAYLAGRLASMRMLILTTYRSSELLLSKHPFLPIKLDLQSRNICREVQLQFLSAEDIAHYLTLEFPEHRFPIELPTLIHAKTEGSPLFMADLVRYLRDRKVISQQQGTWVLAQSVPDVERELPESVRSMIQRKIDQLNEQDRRLLIAASVQGNAFDSAVLAKVLDVDASDVEERLEALERIHAFVRLIDEREFPDLTLTVRYRFVHVLYQNALYSSLRPTRRASLSAAVANALLDHYNEQSSEIASELAFLFKAARSFEQAAEYFLVAAENAARVYANKEAIMFYESASEMVTQLSRGQGKTPETMPRLTTQIYERRGDILEIGGKHDEAREAYRKALANVSKDDTVWMARLHRNLGTTWQTQRQSERALKAFAEAEGSLGQEPVESDGQWSQERRQEWWREWIQIQLEQMWALYWLALVQALNDLAMKTQPILEQYGTKIQRGRFFHMLMLYLLRRDRYVPSDETVTYAEAALTAIQDSNELGEVAAIRFGTGFTYLWLGNFEKAEEHFKAALNFANRRGDSLNQVLCLTYLTIVYRKRGQLEKVQSYILQAVEAATAGQMMPYIGMANANKAWVGWRQRDYSAVKEYGRAALDSWQHGQASYPFQWAALWPLIGVELVDNNVAEAIEYADAMLAPTQQQLPTVLVGIVEEAINEWRANQLEATRTRLDRALTLAQEMGYL